MDRLNRISGIRPVKIFPDTLIIQGVKTRRLSNEEALARRLTDSGDWYVYPDGRVVLDYLVSEALEPDPATRERNERLAREEPINVSL